MALKLNHCGLICIQQIAIIHQIHTDHTMSIIGKLIKTGISLNQKLGSETTSGENSQREQLEKLIETAQNTAFGKYYGFTDLLKSDNIVVSFKERVPIHNYDAMHTEWWSKQLEFPDITWPGKPHFFALSSGTTGKSSKRIPITDDFLASMRKSGTSLIKSLPNYDFPEELFESEVLMLGSSSHLDAHPNGHLEGEISGINVSNFPGWYDMFYRPGSEIAALSDWNDRLARIVEEAPTWNIGAIAGIPSWVLLMLQEIIKHHNLTNIHEIWPNFTVFASGGVAYETYRQDFDAICAKPIVVMDTYLASEGFFAFTARPGTMDMKLVLDNSYFYEFIPFDERGVNAQGELLENPVSHTLAEVEAGQDYVLVISTSAGAWRYVIGDTIRFTDLEKHEIKITGRTKFFLNVVGSQLSEEKMDDAILTVSEELKVSVNEYMVAAVKKDTNAYIHQWVIVCETEVDHKNFGEKLDVALKQANKNYGVARSKALKGIEVEVIDKEKYHHYLEISKKKGGQVKTPKVMTEEKMLELLDVVKS